MSSSTVTVTFKRLAIGTPVDFGLFLGQMRRGPRSSPSPHLRPAFPYGAWIRPSIGMRRRFASLRALVITCEGHRPRRLAAEVQSTLGHGNIATTSGYLHARPNTSSGLHLDPGVFLR